MLQIKVLLQALVDEETVQEKIELFNSCKLTTKKANIEINLRVA